jgi:hypothetical protein
LLAIAAPDLAFPIAADLDEPGSLCPAMIVLADVIRLALKKRLVDTHFDGIFGKIPVDLRFHPVAGQFWRLWCIAGYRSAAAAKEAQ